MTEPAWICKNCNHKNTTWTIRCAMCDTFKEGCSIPTSTGSFTGWPDKDDTKVTLERRQSDINKIPHIHQSDTK